MSLRLIATDLDGTLVGADRRVPPTNIEALERAHERGVTVVVATGRPTRWLDCVESFAQVEPLVIAGNGAVLYDYAARRPLHTIGFPSDEVLELADVIRESMPDVSFGLECDSVFGAEASMGAEFTDHPGVVVGELDDLARTLPSVTKLCAIGRDRDQDAFGALIRDAVGDRATVTWSATNLRHGFAEISVRGVTKATALDRLSSSLGIPPSDAVAFGDMPNDLAMLTWAGRGYVTANAHPSLRSQFPVIGSASDGGVGVQIVRLLDAEG